MKILHLEQNTPEWLEARKETFNASETPALFEENPFVPKNPLELAHLKYGDLDIYQNRAMRAGNENEGWIREKVEEQFGVVLEPLVAAWDEDERFRASFDGIDFDGSFVVEIKYSKKTFQSLKKNRVPKNYFLQVQHQLLVSEAQFGYLVAANPETEEIAISKIKRDDKTIDEIVKRWREFEKEYKGKKLPPLEVKREDVEWELAAAAYKAAKLHYEEAKAALDEARATLIELSGGIKARGAGVVVIPSKKTSYKYSKAKNYIPPQILEQIKTESITYRIEEEKQ